MQHVLEAIIMLHHCDESLVIGGDKHVVAIPSDEAMKLVRECFRRLVGVGQPYEMTNCAGANTGFQGKIGNVDRHPIRVQRSRDGTNDPWYPTHYENGTLHKIWFPETTNIWKSEAKTPTTRDVHGQDPPDQDRGLPSIASPRSPVQQHNLYGLEHDKNVEPDGRVLDIKKVVLQFLFRVLNCVAVLVLNLSPAGDSRPH